MKLRAMNDNYASNLFPNFLLVAHIKTILTQAYLVIKRPI